VRTVEDILAGVAGDTPATTGDQPEDVVAE
jgi:hypothetical protein